jgi:hypothetical protein
MAMQRTTVPLARHYAAILNKKEQNDHQEVWAPHLHRSKEQQGGSQAGKQTQDVVGSTSTIHRAAVELALLEGFRLVCLLCR